MATGHSQFSKNRPRVACGKPFFIYKQSNNNVLPFEVAFGGILICYTDKIVVDRWSLSTSKPLYVDHFAGQVSRNTYTDIMISASKQLGRESNVR